MIQEPTEVMIEAGARALYGEGWEKTASPGNKRYCREKAKAVYEAMVNFTREDQ